MQASEGQVEGPVAEQFPEISMGIPASTCQWPTTLLGSGCTATLVHPRVVTTAAHCPSPSAVRFGEASNKIVANVPVDYCIARPEWNGGGSNNGVGGWDAKVCVLSSAVTTVPIAPIAMGCEIHQIGKDSQEVYIAGFGDNSDSGGFGTKRYIDTIIRQDLIMYGEGTNAVFV
ncbi:MAG: trypsin-like serine protease, partial [Nannocystaceae bacterium]